MIEIKEVSLSFFSVTVPEQPYFLTTDLTS